MNQKKKIRRSSGLVPQAPIRQNDRELDPHWSTFATLTIPW